MAIVWAVIDSIIRKGYRQDSAADWGFFFILNPIQLLFFGLAWYLEAYWGSSFSLLGLNWSLFLSLWVVAVISLLILVIDFFLHLRCLDEAKGT